MVTNTYRKQSKAIDQTWNRTASLAIASKASANANADHATMVQDESVQ